MSLSAALTASPLAAAHVESRQRGTAAPAAPVATLTAKDFRVAVVATRLAGGSTPTADVRIAIAQRHDGGWREKGETRLRGTYFWHAVTGPGAICKLELVTASSPNHYAAVRLLQSPSVGCGPMHRIPLPR